MDYNILNKRLSFLLILLAFSLPVSITLSEALYALAFFVWLIKVVSQGKKSLRYTGLEIPGGIVLGIVYILAILLSPSPLESTEVLKKYILLGLLPLIANNVNSEIEKSRLINIWLLGAIIVSLWNIIEHFRGIPRSGGTTFGHLASMFLFVSLPLVGLKNYKRLSILSMLVLVTGIPALFLNCTRGAWISFITVLILLLIIKRKWLFLATCAITLVLIGLTSFTYFPNSGPGKAVRSLLRPFDKQEPRVVCSNLRRWHMWRVSWQMFTEHPLFGVGLSQFEKEFPN